MVAPTGLRSPTEERNYGRGAGNVRTYYRYKQRGWQKAPFNLPLSYTLRQGNWSQSYYFPEGPYWAEPPSDAELMIGSFYDPALMTEVANKSYDKLKGKVYDQAALGVDFAEAHQSFTMITSTCGTLLKVARSIRKLDFVSAARALRMKFVPKGVSARKSFANNWLEYHFGWEPLIRDIYDSVDVINNPLKAFSKTRASSTLKQVFEYSDGSPTGWDSLVQTTYTYAQGLTVDRIDNSQLHTLEQFGLVNPLSIAWELVPFSFVVDWYANVGQVLASYSDFAGLTIKDSWSTLVYRIIWSGNTRSSAAIMAANPTVMQNYFRGQSVQVGRSSGLTLPAFNIRQLRLPSKVRAVTALSLLVQQLVKK